MSTHTEQDVSQSLSALMDAITRHPSWSAQAAQRRGKLYYMHDFVGNSKRMLEDAANTPDPADTRREVGMRCMFAQMLVNDDTGKLSLMTQDPRTEFTEEVKEMAQRCVDVSGNLI